MSAAATRRLGKVLELGDAIGVLIICDGRRRDQAASQALQQATGRTDIQIARRPSGRPRLLPPYPELGISLSYRTGLMLVGFSPSSRVGVDIEVASNVSSFDVGRLARDHFAVAEAAAIGALPASAAADIFLRLWVVKEALLKTTGRGVADGLAEPDLSSILEELVTGAGRVSLAAGAWRGHAFTVQRIGWSDLATSPSAGSNPHAANAAYLALARVPS